MLTHAIFDLDDTLYPQTSGLWDAIGERINLFMIDRLGLPPDEVKARRDLYFRSFGTTLKGLMRDFHVDPADYLDFAHDLPLEQFIQPDPGLDAMLAALPLRKSIFTNADVKHARRVLNRLGIAQHFDTIVDIWALNFVNKPEPEAYQILLSTLRAEASHCVFVEDSLRNLLPARAMGMTTIWISRNGTNGDVGFVVKNVGEVGPIVNDLLRGKPNG
ncbi:MAG: pyrimidine 5'-nucleotidase [Chloroflexi bacterium]|nr:pyrimidine 5'-nucleotidase [Chloroflexota bacterium]